MTIKEIAELCGVDQSTVWRWAQKFANDFTEKLEEARKSSEAQADFTQEEVSAIIGVGGGNKALASLLTTTASDKNVLAMMERFEEVKDLLEQMEAFGKEFEEFEKWTTAEYKRLGTHMEGLETSMAGIEKVHTLRKYGLPFLLD